MKKLKNLLIVLMTVMTLTMFVACNSCKDCVPAEKITLAETILGEVEFENDENVKLNSDKNVYTISGEIKSMSLAQASAFGVEEVTHVVVIKFVFDKERTIDSFEIKGNTTKVYSSDNSVSNYVGSISDLLDNEPSEDAFCYLILSANTNSYTLTSKYTDETKSEIKLNIDATLVTTNPD